MIDAIKAIKKLKSIRQGSSKHGNAPHKLILILSIVELIEKRYFLKNEFCIDADLVIHFRENWKLLVTTLHTPDFTQPFFYLQNEKIDNTPIWQLYPNEGYQVTNYIKSVNVLKNVVAFGSFDNDFYNLLQNTEFRNIAVTTILDTYFSETKYIFIEAKLKGQGYIHDLTSYLLNENDAPKYLIQVNQLDEDDIFIRNNYFPRLIRSIYSSTCCITGMQLNSKLGHHLIEAAHIIPFSISKNDKVTNGLSLCPNLHTAFDRGLVGIDDNFKILISPIIEERINNPYNLSKLAQKNILLPFHKNSYPDIENIRWHRNNIFIK